MNGSCHFESRYQVPHRKEPSAVLEHVWVLGDLSLVRLEVDDVDFIEADQCLPYHDEHILMILLVEPRT